MKFNKIKFYEMKELILFIGLSLACFIYTYHAFDFFDIGLYDETMYLAAGRELWSIIPSAENAPLYAIWYWILSFYESNNVHLYFLNYALLSAILPIFFYFALRTIGTDGVLSLIIAFALLVSHANLPMWPKVSHFALLILLLGIIVSGNFCEEGLTRLMTLAAAAFIASYARPEFFLGFLLIWIIVIIGFLRSDYTAGLKKKTLFRIGLLSGIFILVLHLTGNPMFSGGRSILAFGQHFSLHYVAWTGDSRSPWTNWEEILSNSFGNPTSIFSAAINNPKLFIKHVAENISQTMPNLIFLIKPYSGNIKYIYAGFTIVSLFITINFFYLRFKNNKILYEGNNLALVRKNGILSIGIICYLIPVFISTSIIFPRGHYVLYLLVFGVALTLCLLKIFVNFSYRHGSLLVITVVVSIAIFLSFKLRPTDKNISSNIAVINFLNDLRFNKPLIMLEAEGGYCTYLIHECKRVLEYEKNVSFREFILIHNINLIIVTPNLLLDTRFKDDEQWKRFLASPAEYQFMKVDSNISGKSFYVR